MVLYHYNLLFGLYPSSLCFSTTMFQGMALPSSSGDLLCWVQSIELASVGKKLILFTFCREYIHKTMTIYFLNSIFGYSSMETSMHWCNNSLSFIKDNYKFCFLPNSIILFLLATLLTVVIRLCG
jgi:hypothetical protein